MSEHSEQSDSRILVPPSTIANLKQAEEAIGRARYALADAAHAIKRYSPTVAALLEDDNSRLEERLARVTDLRKGCRS